MLTWWQIGYYEELWQTPVFPGPRRSMTFDELQEWSNGVKAAREIHSRYAPPC